MIDLHCHSTASDGSVRPAGLVELALELGLTALAITDHDTTNGLAEAAARAAGTALELVSGVELALDYPAGRFHLLGYFIDPKSPVLQERLTRLQVNRSERNAAMVNRLNSLGVAISMDEIVRQSGGGQIGRPHMGMALVRLGVVATVQEAFDKYLADGAIGHIPKDKVGLQEGLDLVHEAGGLACLAHPLSLKLRGSDLAGELARLRAMGLDALECCYSAHTGADTASLLQMAQDAALYPTGGSDFHGTAKPRIQLGQVCDGKPAPVEMLNALKAARLTLMAESVG